MAVTLVDVYIEENAQADFPALLGVEYDYIDYVTDAFGIAKSKMSAWGLYDGGNIPIKN